MRLLPSQSTTSDPLFLVKMITEMPQKKKLIKKDAKRLCDEWACSAFREQAVVFLFFFFLFLARRMQEAPIINSQQQLAAWWMDIHKQDNQTHVLQAKWRPERRFCNPGSSWQRFPSEQDGNLRASIRCVYANAGPKYIQGPPSMCFCWIRSLLKHPMLRINCNLPAENK